MERISLSALINILTTNKLRFIIEQSSKWEEKKVYRFIAHTSPLGTYRHLAGESRYDMDTVGTDYKTDFGAVVLHYDTESQKVIQGTNTWYNIIEKAIKELKDKKREILNKDKSNVSTTGN